MGQGRRHNEIARRLLEVALCSTGKLGVVAYPGKPPTVIDEGFGQFVATVNPLVSSTLALWLMYSSGWRVLCAKWVRLSAFIKVVTAPTHNSVAITCALVSSDHTFGYGKPAWQFRGVSIITFPVSACTSKFSRVGTVCVLVLSYNGALSPCSYVEGCAYNSFITSTVRAVHV